MSLQGPPQNVENSIEKREHDFCLNIARIVEYSYLFSQGEMNVQAAFLYQLAKNIDLNKYFDEGLVWKFQVGRLDKNILSCFRVLLEGKNVQSEFFETSPGVAPKKRSIAQVHALITIPGDSLSTVRFYLSYLKGIRPHGLTFGLDKTEDKATVVGIMERDLKYSRASVSKVDMSPIRGRPRGERAKLSKKPWERENYFSFVKYFLIDGHDLNDYPGALPPTKADNLVNDFLKYLRNSTTFKELLEGSLVGDYDSTFFNATDKTEKKSIQDTFNFLVARYKTLEEEGDEQDQLNLLKKDMEIFVNGLKVTGDIRVQNSVTPRMSAFRKFLSMFKK